jgi:valyl-tRNA synthetase
LASASEVEVAEAFDASVVSADNAVQIITDSATVYLPLSDLVDTEKERARLEGEYKKLTDEIDRVNKKLANESFVAKAPAAVVDAERAKLAKYQENLAGVKTALEKLK